MIDILRQGERGGVEARFPVTEAVRRALVRADQDTRCLAFIDPYGDTTFNQLQIPVLQEELGALRKHLSDPELEAAVDELRAFIALAMGEPHIYVKFIGD